MKRFITAIQHALHTFLFVIKNFEALEEQERLQREEDWNDYWANRI